MVVGDDDAIRRDHEAGAERLDAAGVRHFALAVEEVVEKLAEGRVFFAARRLRAGAGAGPRGFHALCGRDVHDGAEEALGEVGDGSRPCLLRGRRRRRARNSRNDNGHERGDKT